MSTTRSALPRSPRSRSHLVCWLTATLSAATAAALVGCGAPPPVNVLLISIDTLRADALGSYGGPTATPAFDGLAAEGVLFEHAIAPAPETAPSHATLFTGTDVQHHGLTQNGALLTREIETLAEVFRGAGYATAGFASSFVLDRRFGLGRGFDRYDAVFPLSGETVRNRRGFWSSHEFEGFDRRAAATNESAIPWLRDAVEPFFLFVHYFDPHAPNVAPPGLVERVPVEYASATAAERIALWHPRRRPDPAALRQMIRSYHAEVLYTDAALGELLAALDTRGARERTLVVVTADHGEGLGQHELLDHAAHLYEEQVRVPLIFRWPGVLPAGVRISGAVGLVDVAPTLASLAGVEFSTSIDGRSFALPLRSGLEPAERSLLGRRRSYGLRFQRQLGTKFFVRTNRWKYIRSTDDPDELYDLADDPAERHNVHDLNPNVVARLGETLDAQLSAHPVRDEAPDLSPEEQRALEALGYATD